MIDCLWETLIRVRPSGWYSVKGFVAQQPLETDDFLERMLRHWGYRDWSGKVDGRPRAMHGPYWVDGLARSAFTPVSRGDAWDYLDAWDRRPEDEQAADPDGLVEQFVRTPLKSARECLRLDVADPEARHPTAFVHDEFREVIAIDPSGRKLVMIIAGRD